MTHQKIQMKTIMLQNIYIVGKLYLSEKLNHHVQIKVKMHVQCSAQHLVMESDGTDVCIKC